MTIPIIGKAFKDCELAHISVPLRFYNGATPIRTKVLTLFIPSRHDRSVNGNIKDYGPGTVTYISSMPPDDIDLEMQPRGAREILVRNQLSHHNAAIG